MNLKKTIQEAWENRLQIANGFYNTYIVHKPEIDAESKTRKAICESNVCGYYDIEGKAQTSAIPGKPACSLCHCNIEVKSKCESCHCALLDLQLQKLKAILPETNINDVDNCQIKIKELQEQGIDLGTDPLWDKMYSKEIDDAIKVKIYQEQFKNR